MNFWRFFFYVEFSGAKYFGAQNGTVTIGGIGLYDADAQLSDVYKQRFERN